MIQAGVDRASLKSITEEQLAYECNVANSLHRAKILETIRSKSCKNYTFFSFAPKHDSPVSYCADVVNSQVAASEEADADKTLDVFISYRRSNGSQLARYVAIITLQLLSFNASIFYIFLVIVSCSLLKVHMQVRNYSAFLDVEKLEAGKFDNNLLQSVKTAKHFLLVLTPNALDKCLGDHDRKDWVHKVSQLRRVLV
jgi:hypothetical protein